MKPLWESSPDRIRRVCVAPKDSDSKPPPSGFFPYSVIFLVLGVAAVGLIVGFAVTGWFQHYTDLLIKLSEGF